MNTSSTQDTGGLLQDERRALEALQGALAHPDTEGTECVYTDSIGGMFFAIDDHGGGSFFRAPDAVGHMELVNLSPRETLCLSAFWRKIAYAEICLAVEKYKLERVADMAADFEDREPEPPAADKPEVYTAPSLEASRLCHAPRIRLDAERFQRIELLGIDGWSDSGVVEEVVRLERWGLVMVATDDATYVMTAEDFDNPAA